MLDSLHIKNFRCFEDLTIPSLGRVNLIVGKNNTGKSTLLEAVYVYANGGQEHVIDEILLKRGDVHLIKEDYSSFARPYLFHNNKLPSTTINSLKIGCISEENSVQIVPEFLIEEIKKKYNNQDLINSCSNFATPIENNIYLKVINIKNNKLLHKPQSLAPISVSPTNLVSDNDLALIWENIFLDMDESILKSALQTIEKNIVNIAFIHTKNSTKERISAVKIQNMKKAIPIKSLGDGMSRLLQIFLYALQASGGFLLIDEIENGLHYSIQEEVWEKLFKLAKELDIQVFATTHSQDAIKAFSKVALADKEVEGKLIALGRSVGKSDFGKIFATVYDEESLELISDTGIEVR